MAGFIFGGDTGIKNPQELAAKRAIANALLAAQRAPRNVGEGLNALGDGIVAGVLNARGDKAEAAGIESANSAFAPILAALGGGGAFPARPSAPDAMNAPVGAVERAPLPPVEDYASKRVAQAFGDTQSTPGGGFVRVAGAGKGWTSLVGPNGEVRREGARNWRNNNPGNIEYGKFAQSAGAIGTDGRFAVFPSYEAGRAAKAKLLFESPNYRDKTIYGAISRWAPPVENNTNAYANAVASAVGVSLDTPISALSSEQRNAMLDAMEKVEGFRPGKEISIGGSSVGSAQSGSQVAQALAAPQGERSPMSGQSDMPGLGTLIGAMSNPWMNENQGAIVKALLGQRMKEMDPATALERRKLEAEIKALENPQAKPTDDMREYEFAKSQGYQGTFQNWQIDNKRAGATSVNVGSEKGYDKTVGEGYGKRFLDIQTDAQTAQRALNALDVMDQAMADPGFYSGTGGQYVTTLKRAASALGMDAEGISSIETFNAMAKQAALDSMGGSLGTGFSNADRDFVLDQVPNLANTPEGNKQLIDVQRKLNQRKQQIAQFARDYAAQNNGRIDAGFDDALSKWADANQLFPAPPKTDGKGPRKIMSEEEYMGLPSGAEFVAPDGSIRRKP